MKARVRVELELVEIVEIEVDYEPGEDPTDLTPDERRRAFDAAPVRVDWDHATVSDVELAP